MMICYCYFCHKKCFSLILSVVHAGLCSANWPGKQFLEVFFTNFFQNYWITTEVINITWLFKSIKFGSGSRISDEKRVILEFKYLQNKKW